jgi:acetyl-CoA carboxylase biotin carboxylase subunit
VERSGFIFIGPRSETIRLMGDKVSAKDHESGRRARPYPAPTAPCRRTRRRSLEMAREVGYPVIIKAAAGGGGRGMRVVHNEARC